MDDDQQDARSCLGCGATFFRLTPKGKRHKMHAWLPKRFCSRSCASRHHRKATAPAPYPPKPCEACGQPMAQTFPSGRRIQPAHWAKRRYCSLPCRDVGWVRESSAARGEAAER